MINQEQMNILWMLIAASMVLSMQIGFCLLETGLVRSKNSINVAIKNLADLCLSSVIFWIVGFGIMFGSSSGGWLGSDRFFLETSDPWLLAFFVFQLVFCATAITVISGAVAERLHFKGYLLIALVAAGLVYPVFGHWAWAGLIPDTAPGWLAEKGFIDFAGATVVHSVGGWVALAAIMVIGPRLGQFDDPNRRIQGHNRSLASAGVIILWFGWLGFNGGSTLAFNERVPQIIANTMLAGAFAGLASVLASYIYHGRARSRVTMNGIVGGLVAIAACCHVVTLPGAALVGLIAGFICSIGMQTLERMKIDDAVGAVPAHAFCGVWGTLAVALIGSPGLFGTGLSRTEQLLIQIQGVGVAFVWAFGLAFGLFALINKVAPLRVTKEDEVAGLNVTEHGATNELVDLITEMSNQERAGTFDKHVRVEPHTEVGQIAAEYNRVLDRIESELKKREIAVLEADQAKEAAINANQIKSDFVANMSHELRTPLGIISGYAELIREELEEDGNHRFDDDLETIANSVNHLLGLINGVLDISKLESGRMSLDLEHVELIPILEGIPRTFAPLLEENGNRIEVDFSDDIDTLYTDQRKLEQCLLNLLSNANKFTHLGKITLRVTKVENEDDERVHRFEVIDTGIGMSTEQQEMIFQAFRQADNSTTRKYGGTGLGLSITQSFCEMLNGSIWVTSEPDKGSRFTIELPDLPRLPSNEHSETENQAALDS